MEEKIKTLYDLFQCCSTSTHRVVFQDFRSNYIMNFNEFYKSVFDIANFLQPICCCDSVVACLMKPGLLIPTVILSILKVSCAFTFLEIINPMYSLRNLQKFTRIETLLVDDLLLEELKDLCHCWKIVASKSVYNFTFSILQSSACANENCANSNPKSFNKSSSVKLAYIMQTSGTSGKPKIVKVPHQCIIPNIIDLKSKFRVDDRDIILLCSSLTFDPSIIDIFLFGACGSTIVIVPDQMKSIPRKISEVINRYKITILQATPSFISSLGKEYLQSVLLARGSFLRILAFGGETCPSREKLRKWVSEGNKTHLFNLYGLTEVSCWSSCHEINLKNDSEISLIPLGTPLLDTVIKCDDSGELHVGSNKRWCLIDEECCINKAGQVLRATADIVKNLNGDFYFEKRKDCILKYKGKKFSLDIIDSILINDSDISNYAFHYDHSSSTVMLYVVWNLEITDFLIEEKSCELKKNLRKICAHFPPVELFSVPYIPLTSHGKSDYRKLVQITKSKLKRNSSEKIAKQDCTKIILNLWKEYTSTQIVTEESNFIKSGGDSITALQLSSDIEWKFQISAPDLVENILNFTFKDVVTLIHSYLLSEVELKNKEDTIRNNLPSPPCKKVCNSKKCFSVVSRQAFVTHCTCEKDHVFPADIESDGSQISGLYMAFKFSLKKCIDASPSVAYYFESERMLCFIGSHSGMFCCINVLNTKIEWETTLPDRIESSACLSSCGNFVLVGCYDFNLYCFDIKLGNILWKFKTGREIKSSPNVSSQNIVFFGSHDKNIYALNNNGKLLWKNQIGKGSIFSSPDLNEEHNVLVVATLDGIVAVLKMDAGSILWTHDCGKPLFSSPLILSSSIYVGSTDGQMLCFNLSGTLTSTFKTSAPIFSSASHSPSKTKSIIFGSHDCCVYCLDKDLKKCWSFSCDSPVYATPFSFVHKEQHYVAVASTKGTLHILNQNNGKEISSYKFPNELFSSPVVVNNFLFIGCRDDNIYCFKLNIS